MREPRLLIFATHPIQYQVPIYQELAKEIPLLVVYCMRQNPKGQAAAGFGVEFEWDIPLLDGYDYQYIENTAKKPCSSTFNGISINKSNVISVVHDFKPTHALLQGWFPQCFLQIKNTLQQYPQVHVLCRGDSTLMMTQNPFKRFLKRFYIPWVLRGIDTFLYVGTANKSFYKHYGISESRLKPAYHCINTPLFTGQDVQKRTSKNPQKLYLGFVGKFIDKKDPALILEALATLPMKKNIVLRFIGDGPLKSFLKQRARQFDVHVEFLGFMNQRQLAMEGYQHMDCLVLPSKYAETWGLVVNEAMTQGVPCIVSDCVGCYPDLIQPGITGWVFKAGEVAALKNVLQQAHESHQSGRWPDLKSGVKKRIESYSLENTVNQVLASVGV